MGLFRRRYHLPYHGGVHPLRDELFRWNLSFSIRHPERAEPSDWEIAGRYISWTALAVMALIAFIFGLLA